MWSWRFSCHGGSLPCCCCRQHTGRGIPHSTACHMLSVISRLPRSPAVPLTQQNEGETAAGTVVGQAKGQDGVRNWCALPPPQRQRRREVNHLQTSALGRPHTHDKLQGTQDQSDVPVCEHDASLQAQGKRRSNKHVVSTACMPAGCRPMLLVPAARRACRSHAAGSGSPAAILLTRALKIWNVLLEGLKSMPPTLPPSAPSAAQGARGAQRPWYKQGKLREKS